MKGKMQSTAWILAVALGSAACVEDIPDLNDPGQDSLLANPTAASISAVTTGLLVGSRVRIAPANGYIALLGIVGREAYNLDAADPRLIVEMLEGPLDASSLVFGAAFWIDPYANLRTANVVLQVVDDVEQLSDEEKNGVKAFNKTIQAVDFFMLISSRDELGAVIDVTTGNDVNVLGDVRCKPAVLAHIISLLDEAASELANAGDSFAFPLSTGFAGFDTPATFLQFNRALAARAHIYAGNYAEALTAIGESFITLDADQLELGAYHAYSGNPGDTSNALNSVNIVAHPRIRMDAETSSTTGMIDARVARKLVELEEPVARAGLSSTDDFTAYQTVDDPVAIIRNEDLILLRAEANLMLSNTASAAADVNWIRVNSGGLDPLPEADAATAAEILRQRRYSLMFEGHRWVDTRRLGNLEDLLDEDEDRGDGFAPFTVPTNFPIPLPEVRARFPDDANVTTVGCVD